LWNQQKQLKKEYYKSKKNRPSGTSSRHDSQFGSNNQMNSNNTNQHKYDSQFGSNNHFNSNNQHNSNNTNPNVYESGKTSKKHKDEKRDRTNSFVNKFVEFTTNNKDENFPFNTTGDFTTNENKEGEDVNRLSNLKLNIEKKEKDKKTSVSRCEHKLLDSENNRVRISLNKSLGERSIDNNSKDLSFMDKSGDSQFSGSYEDSFNSVEMLKEKMEEERRIHIKNIEEKNGKVILTNKLIFRLNSSS